MRREGCGCSAVVALVGGNVPASLARVERVNQPPNCEPMVLAKLEGKPPAAGVVAPKSAGLSVSRESGRRRSSLGCFIES